MSRPSSPRLTSPDKLDVSGTRLTFKGDTKSDAGSLEHRHYAVDIELFAEASIKGEPRLIGKSLSVVLQKKGPSRSMHGADVLQRRPRVRRPLLRVSDSHRLLAAPDEGEGALASM